MPSFTVRIQRTTTHYTDITIAAASEDAADTKAIALTEDPSALEVIMRRDSSEWELDDETYELLEINEE